MKFWNLYLTSIKKTAVKYLFLQRLLTVPDHKMLAYGIIIVPVAQKIFTAFLSKKISNLVLMWQIEGLINLSFNKYQYRTLSHRTSSKFKVSITHSYWPPTNWSILLIKLSSCFHLFVFDILKRLSCRLSNLNTYECFVPVKTRILFEADNQRTELNKMLAMCFELQRVLVVCG